MPTPIKGVTLPSIYFRNTFVECEESFIFDDFHKTIGNAVVHFISGRLGLQSDLDDFEGLHDEDLGPAWIKEKHTSNHSVEEGEEGISKRHILWVK